MVYWPHDRPGQQRATSQGPEGEDNLPDLPLFKLFCPVRKYGLHGTALDRAEGNSRSLGPATVLITELWVSEDLAQPTGEGRYKEDLGLGPPPCLQTPYKGLQ